RDAWGLYARFLHSSFGSSSRTQCAGITILKGLFSAEKKFFSMKKKFQTELGNRPEGLNTSFYTNACARVHAGMHSKPAFRASAI
ncbi:MAG TPA: hypothetical protein VFO40_04035, partial [Chthoniobacterales bacterium]|nr:hypothetical protein [Chthoniobacterales bacterium]